MRILVASLAILCLMASGCATANGALGGTTNLKSHYESTVQTDGAEKTVVDVEAKGKAADVLEAVTSASLMTKDSEGNERNMSFGANQNNDATLRGQLYVEAHRDDIEYRKAVAEQTTGLIDRGMQLAAPIVGGHVQSGDARADVNAQAQAAQRQQIIDIGSQLLPQIQSSISAQLSQYMPKIVDAVMQRLNAAPSAPPVTRPTTVIPEGQPPRLVPTLPDNPPAASNPPGPLTDGTLPPETNLSPEP